MCLLKNRRTFGSPPSLWKLCKKALRLSSSKLFCCLPCPSIEPINGRNGLVRPKAAPVLVTNQPKILRDAGRQLERHSRRSKSSFVILVFGTVRVGSDELRSRILVVIVSSAAFGGIDIIVIMFIFALALDRPFTHRCSVACLRAWGAFVRWLLERVTWKYCEQSLVRSS